MKPSVLWLLLSLSPATLVYGQVQGNVRDSHKKPISGAIVTLSPGFTAQSDSNGHFAFPSVQGGRYTVKITKKGYRDESVGPLSSGASIDVTLNAEAEFFDEPTFTVAGLADMGSRGGHGSDTILRSTEKLTDAATSLGNVVETSSALESARQYQRAAESDPTEPHLFDWGADLLKHRAAAPAEAVFTKGNRLFPQSVRMLLGLAVAEYALGSYDDAAQHLCQASDLNPKDPTPYLFMGKVETTTPVFVERLARFAKLQSNNALANYYYAVSLYKARDAARAETYLKKTLQLDPKMGSAYLQLGILYSDRKDLGNALSCYRKAAEVSPDLVEAHYRLGQAYERMGDSANAQKEIATYKQLSATAAAEAERKRSEIQRFVIALPSH